MPLAKILARLGVKPVPVTIFATFIGIVSAYLFAVERFYEGAVILLISQIVDCADGDLARITGSVTKKGAYLDRVLDRFVDAAILIGLMATNPEKLWLVGSLAMLGTFGVSITRVMAEVVGTECKVGIGGRDLRTLIILVGVLVGEIYYLLAILVFLGFTTSIHRVAHTMGKLRDKK
ncbi:MAG: CDP-alcohol phosphatidyltransferase family protein [Candidatus Hydrothermarchaeota archaeon]|nr:CDP-alcohol phosphatidyltransferase family protein [Candidatus Hydrothermarchaeota archaeon]